MSQVCDELSGMEPAVGFSKVYYPGERAALRRQQTEANEGIEIVDDIYRYLISDDIHYNRYDHKNRFAD